MSTVWRKGKEADHSMNSQGFCANDHRGFSLAELLVAMAVLGLVMGAVLTVCTTGTSIGLKGENKAEAQQAGRAAALLNDDLRLAGYGYPASQSQITPLPPTASLPPLTAAIITAASATSLTFMADLMNVSTTLSSDANSGTTQLSVTSVAGFAAGDSIFLINGGQAGALRVSSILGATNKINVTTGVICPGSPAIPSPCYPAGSQVGRPRVITYTWSAGTLSKNGGDGNGAQTVADGIQAFQLRYFDAGDVEITAANLATNLANIRRIALTLTAQSVAAQNRQTFAINSAVRPRNL